MPSFDATYRLQHSLLSSTKLERFKFLSESPEFIPSCVYARMQISFALELSFGQVKLYFDIILYYRMDPERISVDGETIFFIC